MSGDGRDEADVTIAGLLGRSHEYARAKGFWDHADGDPVSLVPEKLTLIHEEVSEAMREWRKDPEFPALRYRDDGKPEGLPAELADVILRVTDLASALGVDLEHALVVKMDYNDRRPHRHGDVVR